MMKKKKNQQNQNQRKSQHQGIALGRSAGTFIKGCAKEGGESTPSSAEPFSGGVCGGFECLLPFNSDTAKLAGEMEKDHGDD